jgi:hypothetical protein
MIILALAALAPLSLAHVRAADVQQRVDGDGDPADKRFSDILPTEEDEYLPAVGKVTDGLLDYVPAGMEKIREAAPQRPSWAPLMGITYTPGYEGFQYNAGDSGLRADLSAVLSYSPIFASPDYYLLPETMKPSTSCVESGIIEWLQSGTLRHYFNTYDWCGPFAGGDGTGGIQHVWDTNDTTWRSKYTHVASWPSMSQSGVNYDDKTIHLRIQPTGVSPFCTEADLWNYTTGAYDQADVICGTPDPNYLHGWAHWESQTWDYTPYPPCNAIGSYNVAEGRSIYRLYNGTWYLMAAYNVSEEYQLLGQAWNGDPVCIGGLASFQYWGLNYLPGGSYNGQNFAICGNDGLRTPSNPVCN